MRILKVEPGKAPYVKDMADGLEAIQQEVQGLFQPVYVEDGVIQIGRASCRERV